jgi:hypothetical protein
MTESSFTGEQYSDISAPRPSYLARQRWPSSDRADDAPSRVRHLDVDQPVAALLGDLHGGHVADIREEIQAADAFRGGPFVDACGYPFVETGRPDPRDRHAEKCRIPRQPLTDMLRILHVMHLGPRALSQMGTTTRRRRGRATR